MANHKDKKDLEKKAMHDFVEKIVRHSKKATVISIKKVKDKMSQPKNRNKK